jgi:hypothetical protein
MIVRNPLGGNLLIGALLDRLGHAQAQALLQRLDRLLSQEDRDDLPPRTGSRRRHAETGVHHFEGNTPSKTQKDPS